MNIKNKKFIFFTIIFLFIFLFVYYQKALKNIKSTNINEQIDDAIYNSNIIKDVKYTSIDPEGNEYTIKALKGEIDFNNTNIIYLTDVYAFINLTNSEEITIFSDYGKYNSVNYDTIFSKNVIIKYLENKITAEYLDFSLLRNLMLISKNVVYSNVDNILKADAIEINVQSKDTKVFMYEQNKKVNIKSKN